MRTLVKRLGTAIPVRRLTKDPLRTLAYGTDASFYRLTPQLVVHVETEEEVRLVLRECRQLRISVTFRAAGTSLSGQAITDSVLIKLGNTWRRHDVLDTADSGSVGPFRSEKATLVETLESLGRETRANKDLARKIRHK